MHGVAVAGVLPGRPHHEELDLVAMMARWREHHSAQRSAA